MAMNPFIVRVAGIAALASLAACATAPTHSGAPPATTAQITGSMIPVPVNPAGAQFQSAAPMQVVTAEQLENTGHTTVGGALRELVPALH